MRLLEHPGPAEAPRSLIAWGAASRSYRITIPSGTDFMDTVIAAMSEQSVVSAGIVLLGGSVSRLAFMTGRPIRPDEAITRVASHNGPHEIACPARIVGGNAILGQDREGAPLIHCHALFVDRHGAACGGHLIRGGCIAAPEGIRLHATALADIAFRNAYDAETDFEIFHPATLGEEGSQP